MVPEDVITSVIHALEQDSTGYTGAMKWNYVLNVLKVEKLDILADFDFKMAYQVATKEALQAAMFLAELKFKVYNIMLFRQAAGTQAMLGYDYEYHTHLCWFNKLRDKLAAEIDGVEMKHTWLN